jgi:hypothetical protein
LLSEKMREKDLIELYYTNLGQSYFLDAIKNYCNRQGFGIGAIWCLFANELQPWEEGYFGETGVAYFYEYPAVEKDEVLVVDYDVFFDYLQKASKDFTQRNPGRENEIREYLAEIKRTLKLV